MSNPFNPFQTRSALRFPPGARIRPCKLLIYKHFIRSDFLHSPILATIWPQFYLPGNVIPSRSANFSFTFGFACNGTD